MLQGHTLDYSIENILTTIETDPILDEGTRAFLLQEASKLHSNGLDLTYHQLLELYDID